MANFKKHDMLTDLKVLRRVAGGAARELRLGRRGLEQIGMCASIGEGKNEYVVLNVQVFPEACQFYDFKLHARRNSLSFAGSVQRGAVGSFAILRDSSRSSTSRSCLLFLVSANGIPPTSRIFAIKQLKAVDIFMPMSSSISSTSSFRAASVRNVMLVVIICTPIVSQSVMIIPYCSNNGNTPSRNFAPITTLKLTPSRRNGRISRFNN